PRAITWLPTVMPNSARSRLAIAPAATRAVVSRADARSRMSRASVRSYLRRPARSACPGRGRCTRRSAPSLTPGAGPPYAAGPREVHAAQRLVAHAGSRRLGRHRDAPVLPIAVPDDQRDRRVQRLTEPDSGDQFGTVVLDLHARATAVAALAAPELGVDVPLH